MLSVAWRNAIYKGAVPVLLLLFLLSCQGLPAHSEDGCHPVITAAQGPTFTASLEAPVFVCPTPPVYPAPRPLRWERPWTAPIVHAQDPPSSLASRAPPSLPV